MAGTLTIGGFAEGLLSGEKIIGPVTMTGVGVLGEIEDFTLASGDNAILVPAGATAVLMVLSASNSAELTLRTNLNSGDGGVPFGPTGFVVWPLFAGTTSLIVNASSSGGTLEATFI